MAGPYEDEAAPGPPRMPEFHAKALGTSGYVVVMYHPTLGLIEHAVETTTGIRNLAKEFCDACSVVATN